MDSALQHPEVGEVLLVEDGSEDTSLTICEKLSKKDERVILLRHPDGQNRGAGASRNRGIGEATQPYLSFLDADDYYLANRFEKETKIWKKDKGIDGVYGALGINFQDAEGENAWQQRREKNNQKDITTLAKVVNPDELFEYLIRFEGQSEGHLHLNTLTVKLSALKKQKLLFNEDLRLHQDADFFWRLAYYLKLVPGEIKAPIAIRGVHKGNRFINNPDEYKSLLLQYESIIDWATSNQIERKYFIHFKLKLHTAILHSHGKMKHFNSVRNILLDPDRVAIILHLMHILVNKNIRK